MGDDMIKQYRGTTVTASSGDGREWRDPYGDMIAQFDTESAAQGFMDTEKSGRSFVAVLYFPGTYKVFERIER